MHGMNHTNFLSIVLVICRPADGLKCEPKLVAVLHCKLCMTVLLQIHNESRVATADSKVLVIWRGGGIRGVCKLSANGKL